ncbi:MAG: hypothetical protein V4436_03660 [Patescibacteria group bacterium]
MSVSKQMKKAIAEYEKGIKNGTITDVPDDPLDGQGVTKKQAEESLLRLDKSNYLIPKSLKI